MKTLGAILPLLLAAQAATVGSNNNNNKWGHGRGFMSSGARYEQYNKPSYVNQVLYYSQFLALQHHQQRGRSDYLGNRVKGEDADRVVFTDSPHVEDQVDGWGSSANVNSIRRPTVPTSNRGFAQVEPTPASSTPAPSAGKEDASSNAIPTGPSRCVWAIVSCCTPRASTVRYECFELLGCQGAFWDNSPCEGRFAQSAAKVALDFYSKG